MNSLESLREIRELESFLFGGVSAPRCTDYCQSLDIIREEQAREMERNEQQYSPATDEEGILIVTGKMIIDEETGEMEIYDRNQLSLFRNKETGEMRYKVTEQVNPGWEQCRALVPLSFYNL